MSFVARCPLVGGLLPDHTAARGIQGIQDPSLRRGVIRGFAAALRTSLESGIAATADGASHENPVSLISPLMPSTVYDPWIKTFATLLLLLQLQAQLDGHVCCAAAVVGSSSAESETLQFQLVLEEAIRPPARLTTDPAKEKGASPLEDAITIGNSTTPASNRSSAIVPSKE